jgi:2'-5' RNA ligase
MNQEKSKHRLFFALWPGDEIRQQIVSAFTLTPQYKMRGRIMQPSNLHITLHFIGSVSEDQKHCLHQAAQTVTGETCTLQLDYYGHFYRARVFWLGCHEIPETLSALYQNLGSALQTCDYRMERRPYAPHVTLMRKLNRPGEMITPQPIEWPINEFVLVESVPVELGVEYRVIERYPLVQR